MVFFFRLLSFAGGFANRFVTKVINGWFSSFTTTRCGGDFMQFGCQKRPVDAFTKRRLRRSRINVFIQRRPYLRFWKVRCTFWQTKSAGGIMSTSNKWLKEENYPSLRWQTSWNLLQSYERHEKENMLKIVRGLTWSAIRLTLPSRTNPHVAYNMRIEIVEIDDAGE